MCNQWKKLMMRYYTSFLGTKSLNSVVDFILHLELISVWTGRISMLCSHMWLVTLDIAALNQKLTHAEVKNNLKLNSKINILL